MEFTTPNQHDLAAFLKEVDGLFHIPLSAKRDLGELAEKIHAHGRCLLACEGEKAIGGICWYDNDTATGHSHFTILAVLPQYQGRGVAGALLEKAISMQPPHIGCIRLSTCNPVALHLYLKHGFVYENAGDNEETCAAHGCDLVKTLG